MLLIGGYRCQSLSTQFKSVMSGIQLGCGRRDEDSRNELDTQRIYVSSAVWVGYEYRTALYDLSRLQRKGRLRIVKGRKDNEASSLNGASVLDSSVNAAVIRASFNYIVV